MVGYSLSASNRRTFLKSIGVAATAAIAGCTEDVSIGSESNNTGGSGYGIDPVTFIVPFGAGGGVDRSTRQIQPYFEENLGVKIKPEYKPGAGTQIGTQAVLNGRPDGGTIGAASIPAFDFTMLVGGAEYSMSDFTWIGNLLEDPGLLRAHKNDDRFDTVEDVFNYAKQNPGELKVSTSGPYNQNVLGLALLQEATGAKFNIVPYDGGSASRGALVKREVDLVHANVFNSLGTADSTRVLAVHADENKWGQLTDDAPTFSDALGFDQSAVPPSAPQVRYAWFTSAKVEEQHSDRIEQLRTAFEKSIKSDQYVQDLKEKNPPIDTQVAYYSGEETAQMNEEKHNQLKEYLDLMEKAVDQ
ncbi:Bug family tripartite tricarboxylate transporter substrate binding protein [Halomarina halobia]|uniref:Bug family tripartite tricarboxylate transporter substrate binding protein n=1 Tax=Halomarina halobia TaxID=3033386 RepID=A0ABD6AFM5_9EURY|nr:tripartite tricarboxylate transporter substrate-binding protein [Halomarina sp. PSR21]